LGIQVTLPYTFALDAPENLRERRAPIIIASGVKALDFAAYPGRKSDSCSGAPVVNGSWKMQKRFYQQNTGIEPPLKDTSSLC
jgi:hypothetical protein